MKIACALPTCLLVASSWSLPATEAASAQSNYASLEESLTAAQTALRRNQYAQAIQVLQDALKHFPGDIRLRVQLGRAYLYDHQDRRAMQVLRQVLRDDPSNREARLELARALGYKGDYKASDELYRELLKVNPDDEPASVGLVRNLIHQRRTIEAGRELDSALARHPNNQLLKKYKDRLEKGQLGGPERGRAANRLQGGGDYFSDSAGNRSWRASQQFDYSIIPRLSSRVHFEERSLWQAGTPRANVLSATEELQLQLSRALLVSGGGGSVRFADSSSRGLYRGDLEFHPARDLWLDGLFSRYPINPTYRAAQFNLLAEGWQTRADWRPGNWRMYANMFRQHYSDGNRRQREGAEVLRWLGSSRLAFGTGYQVTYFTFSDHFVHGYFNPRQYVSHMGLAGARFRVGKSFRGEYLARIGAESLSPGASTIRDPYSLAWEVGLRNRFLLGNWEAGGDYYYFRVAQDTGAFYAQAGSLALAYRF